VAFLADGRIVEAGPSGSFFAAPAAPQTRAFLAKVLKY
jgi:polar amino acid transport system ATP-binding protein